MSLKHRVANSVVRALAISAALALISLMASTPAQAQGSGNAKPWVAPQRASQRANPLPPTADALKRGRNLFHRDCEQCHGKAGHGDGPLAVSLLPRPADLAPARVQSQSDGALFWKMSTGRGVMPKVTLSENERWALVNYLRTLAAQR
ncbi:MAG: c-type cytochrome [Gemmatimonadaceae bacterium]|nr:c-type cytochrome [Gemmatimonadaceae bacterium]